MSPSRFPPDQKHTIIRKVNQGLKPLLSVTLQLLPLTPGLDPPLPIHHRYPLPLSKIQIIWRMPLDAPHLTPYDSTKIAPLEDASTTMILYTADSTEPTQESSKTHEEPAPASSVPLSPIYNCQIQIPLWWRQLWWWRKQHLCHSRGVQEHSR